jgi:hypothetical protein
VWLDWGTSLITLLALLTIVAGLVVLALPDAMEGPVVIQLDAAHSLSVTDLVGVGLVAIGALVTWAAVLAWQRKRLHE